MKILISFSGSVTSLYTGSVSYKTDAVCPLSVTTAGVSTREDLSDRFGTQGRILIGLSW